MQTIRENCAFLKTSFPFLILTTGISGFVLGAWTRPTWQVAVESAQALAGVVSYPAGNSFYIYHVKLWTIINQVLAVFMKAGVSEHALSIAVSGAVAALSYMAVGVCAFAISRNAFWGIAAPFLLDHATARNVLEVNYPLDFLGTPHTYGVAGLAWIVMTIGLIAMGRRAWAGFCLGLAPAIHPSLGAWCWIVLALTLLWGGGDSWKTIRAIWKPAATGVALTVTSLLVQLTWLRPALPAVSPEVRDRFISTWVAYFDYHRRPVDMSLPGVKLSMAVIVIGLYLILILDEERDAVPLFALKATVVTAALALGGAAISLLPPSTIPSSLLMLMPTRLFLAANLLFAAVSLGLLGRYSSRWMRGASLVFATLLAFNSGPVMFYGFMAAGAVVALWKSVTALYVKTERAAAPFWLNVSVAALVIALVVKTVTGYAFGGAESRKALADNQANTVVQAAAAGKGLLLIGQQCCYLTQLQTRRPLLVEANALDQIPYAPESAPAANAALKAVYGVDLLDPPESVRSPGMPQGLTPVTKPLWEARSAEEWKELGEVFGFTQVLANAEWRLHLPEVARDPAQVLYAIPVVSSSGQ